MLFVKHHGFNNFLSNLIKKSALFFFITMILACSKNDDSALFDSSNSNNENPFSFNLDLNSEFPIGHNLGLNYFNDITVGVISNNSNEIKLLTAVQTSSFVFSGTSISNITNATQVATPKANTFYSNYIGLGQLIKDSNGVIYSVFHAEVYNGKISSANIPGFNASVGLGISYDNGDSFQINSEPIIQNIYDLDYDNGFDDGGLGEPSITFTKDRKEVYVYYVDHNRSGRGVNISMVKFKVNEDGTPDFSTCYYLNDNKQFTTSVIRSKEVVAELGNVDSIFPHVSYNSFIDKYVMVYSRNNYDEYINGLQSPLTSGIYYRESQDGISWTESPKKLITDWSVPFSFDRHSFTWHPTIIYNNDSQDSGFLIFSKADSVRDGHKMWAMRFSYSEN